jgi:hypothetical protein
MIGLQTYPIGREKGNVMPRTEHTTTEAAFDCTLPPRSRWHRVSGELN